MIRIIKKISQILDKKQKRRVWIIILLMIIGSILETFSVSMMLPLVSAIMSPNIIESNQYVADICSFLGIGSSRGFILLVILGLIALYTFKNFFLLGEYYIQARFLGNNRLALQQKLFRNFLYRPYEYYLNATTAEINQVVTGDANATYNLLSFLISFVSEMIVAMALMMTILLIDPIITITIVLTMSILLLLLNSCFKPLLKKMGESLRINTTQTNKWLYQSISGIKEIKVAAREDYFLDQYSFYGRKSVNIENRNNALSNVPRLSIETFSIGTMLGVVAILIFNGKDLDAMIPQLSAIVMASVRLLPSVNRMSGALNAISYQENMVDSLIRTLRNEDVQYRIEPNHMFADSDSKDLCPEITLSQQVELLDVTYAYPGAETNVLEHATMCIPIGKSVGIVGKSGAGKTTAVDILLGLLKPQKGAVLADGIDINQNSDAWLKHIGYIPQSTYMLDESIRVNVAFGIPENQVNDSDVWKALEEAQLKDYVESLPQGIDTTIGERGIRLSGGQRQRIGIARALYKSPELLVFDEATSALDGETESAIMESIYSLHGKKTMVIIAHRLGTIESCDIIYRVGDGRVERISVEESVSDVN